ncbi:MAG: c-type cytochrome [Verrucomicrobiota bacterium JB023]|nr:c-type cytochrome [Verrucomicrobiota bacterium JB023]
MALHPILILIGSVLLPALAQAEEFAIFDHERATEELKRFGDAEFESGKALYQKVCAVCHGDLQKPAINDTVRRFHEVPLENGSTPLDIYGTLTYGYKTMAPQPWMDARQKYEVIHYIREEFFKEHNPSQYVTLDDDYTQFLWSRPDASLRFPWPESTAPDAAPSPHSEVDNGPALFGHFEVNPSHYVPKGLIISLDPENRNVSSSQHNALYDLDTGRLAAFWQGGPVTWTDIVYDGQHSQNARVKGEVIFESPMGIAWTKKQEVTPGKHIDFRDPREQGLDGRSYGPLPKDHLRYKGLFLNGDQPAIHFEVNGIDVIDKPWLARVGEIDYYVRSITVAPHEHEMYLRLQGKIEAIATKTFFGSSGDLLGRGNINDGIARLSPADKPLTFHFVATHPKNIEQLGALEREDLLYEGQPLAQNFPWPELPDGSGTSYLRKDYSQAVSMEADYQKGEATGAFKVDTIQLAQTSKNPWKTRIRLSGIDFIDEDTAALCSWSGDVFIAENIQGKDGQPVILSRIGAGLHQPLGLVVRDGEIFVGCRGQIMRPHDLDGDAVADYYEAFNTDHVVTMHFHDFSAGLDTDQHGNFYYAKCSQHWGSAVHKRHGTLIRVSADGSSSEIIATGLRSNNGMFVEDDETIWLTDQEGFWNPQNKILRVKLGGFHGNMLAWHDNTQISASDDDMEEPMIWAQKSFSNSPSEVFRFPAEGWGNLNSKLGYFGYGRGHLMIIANEEKGDVLQGFTQRLDLPPFPTGIMRGEFHPSDHSLFACGLFGWGSNRTEWGGLFRITPTEHPSYSLTGIETAPGKLSFTLSDAIEGSELKPADITLTTYSIERSARYGSKLKDENPIAIETLEVSEDGQTITLGVPDLAPARIVILRAELPTGSGVQVREFQGSLYEL